MATGEAQPPKPFFAWERNWDNLWYLVPVDSEHFPRWVRPGYVG